MDKKIKKTKLDDEQIIELAKRGCSQREIAYALGCKLEDLVFNHLDALTRGRELGRIEVRKLMWEKAQGGNSIALRYLVYNVLNESLDKEENMIDINYEQNVLKKIDSLSSEEILRIIKKQEAKQKALPMKREVKD